MRARRFVTSFACLFLVFFLAPLPHPVAADGTAYYVSENGDDANDGRSPDTPLRTIQKASDFTLPGDTVYIMNGTYRDSSNSTIVTIQHSGESGRPITYKPYPNHKPVLKPASFWNGVAIYGASYIIIEGLEIYGNNENISLAEAQSHQNDGNYAPMNTNCIGIIENSTTKAQSHHIIIRGNHIHHCPGAGIASVNNDYLTFENNIVHSNAWYTVYAASGLSMLTPQDIDDYTGYKLIFRNNLVYDNETYIPWINTGKISDGNGIIIDTTNANISDSSRVAYKGRTLITNNVAFNNGGSGIHSFQSSHVDIINNTAYLNSHSPALEYASISASASSDVHIFNNITYARAGLPVNSTYANTDVTYDYNIYFNGAQPSVMGAHDQIADPQFSHPSLDPQLADFRLRSNSPAIDSGTATLAPNNDYNSASRPAGNGIDRGAFEYHYPVFLPMIQNSTT